MEMEMEMHLRNKTWLENLEVDAMRLSEFRTSGDLMRKEKEEEGEEKVFHTIFHIYNHSFGPHTNFY